MIAALQMYLDSTFKESHVVTDIRVISGGGYNSGSSFTIEPTNASLAGKNPLVTKRP